MERRRILRLAKDDSCYDFRDRYLGRILVVESIKHSLHKGPYVAARGLVKGEDYDWEMSFYMVLLSKPITETEEENNGSK